MDTDKDGLSRGGTGVKPDKTKVAVEIFGMQYWLAGHETDEHLRRVAGMVDDRMRKIASGHPRLDLPRLAVLAAANIADEYLKLQEKVEKEREGREKLRAEEWLELRRRYEELSDEHRRTLESLEEARKKEAELAERLRSLQEEYTKLQNEYNEWIQLVDSEPAEPGR